MFTDSTSSMIYIQRVPVMERVMKYKCTYIIQIYSGITVVECSMGSFLNTKILGVNLFAFANRLLHEDFSPINRSLQSTMLLIGEKSS